MKKSEKLRLFWHAVAGNDNARSLLWWKLLRLDRLLYKHGLHHGDLVYDVGGYLGDWTWGMLAKYSCAYHVFEPHPEAFSRLKVRFVGRSEVTMHEFALGSANGLVSLSSAAEGSSIVSNRGSDSVVVKLIDVREHLCEAQHPIALMKLNIEGAEFDLLEALLWSDAKDLAGDLLVQFHAGAPDAVYRYQRIAQKLRETHRCVWRYAFLWELWRKIDR